MAVGLDAPGIALSFGAGAITFFSPCVLPIVPGYLAMLSGSTTQGQTSRRRRAVPIGAFVLGFGIVFTLLGAGASLFSGVLLTHRRELEIVGGAMLVLMGIAFLGVALPGLLGRDLRIHSPAFARRSGPVAALACGGAFAAGWSPCIGPTLGGVLTLAATSGSVPEGMLLLAVFTLGLGLPFAVFGLLAQGTLNHPRVRRLLPVVRSLSAAVMLAAGLLLITGQFTQLASRATAIWSPSL